MTCCPECGEPWVNHAGTEDPICTRVQMCTAADLIPDEPECLRVARWSWQPDPDDHPYLLCNFHGEPLIGLATHV